MFTLILRSAHRTEVTVPIDRLWKPKPVHLTHTRHLPSPRRHAQRQNLKPPRQATRNLQHTTAHNQRWTESNSFALLFQNRMNIALTAKQNHNIHEKDEANQRKKYPYLCNQQLINCSEMTPEYKLTIASFRWLTVKLSLMVGSEKGHGWLCTFSSISQNLIGIRCWHTHWKSVHSDTRASIYF